MTDQDLLQAMGLLIEQKIAPLYTQLDGIDSRFDQIDSRLDGMDARLDGVENQLEGMDHRLSGVENQLVGMDHRLSGVENQLVGMDHRLTGVELTLENDVSKQIGLLMEEHREILNRLPSLARQDDLEERVEALETAVQELKMAQ